METTAGALERHVESGLTFLLRRASGYRPEGDPTLGRRQGVRPCDFILARKGHLQLIEVESSFPRCGRGEDPPGGPSPAPGTGREALERSREELTRKYLGSLLTFLGLRLGRVEGDALRPLPPDLRAEELLGRDRAIFFVLILRVSWDRGLDDVRDLLREWLRPYAGAFGRFEVLVLDEARARKRGYIE